MSDRGSGLEPGGSRVQAGGGAGLTEDPIMGRRRRPARPAGPGLVRGKTVGIDATTLEANAAMRSIERRDTGESYGAFVRRLAKASRIEAPHTHVEAGRK